MSKINVRGLRYEFPESEVVFDFEPYITLHLYYDPTMQIEQLIFIRNGNIAFSMTRTDSDLVRGNEWCSQAEVAEHWEAAKAYLKMMCRGASPDIKQYLQLAVTVANSSGSLLEALKQGLVRFVR